MKKALIALAVVAFVAAGAAQPASGESPEDMRQPELDINDSEDEANETGERDDRARGDSAQFDARLGVAINTVGTLVEIAPNDEARNGLENALEQLRQVQNQTDTASLGSDEEETETGEDEDLGRDTGEAAEEGPGAREPSRNENRPGFVNRMLSGLFG